MAGRAAHPAAGGERDVRVLRCTRAHICLPLGPAHPRLRMTDPEQGRPVDPPEAPTTDDRPPTTNELPGDPARLKGMPEYKGEPLDAERGPGLGCFWIQVGLLTFFLVFTPLTVTWGWDPVISAALLIFTLILLLFTGQTVIFLLRLVAADRRTRRAPLDPSAKPTVGQMEDAEARAAAASEGEPSAGTGSGSVKSPTHDDD